MAFADQKRTYALLALVLVALVGGAAWFAVSYLRVERAAVRAAASPALKCPAEQIDVGAGYQLNDELSQIPVSGCGMRGIVLCEEHAPIDEPFLSSIKPTARCTFMSS